MAGLSWDSSFRTARRVGGDCRSEARSAGVSPWKIRVNQAWNSEQWVTIGTFAMENGGNVVLTNNGSSLTRGGEGYSDFDVATRDDMNSNRAVWIPEGSGPGPYYPIMCTPVGS